MRLNPKSEMTTDQTWAVVPAAGVGSRMGGEAGDPAKQFRELDDAPILVHTLRALASAPGVTGLVVVVGEEEVEPVRQRLSKDAPLADALKAVVAGGATRQASVARGVARVPDEVGIILVHDAVRPFVRAEDIEAVIQAVRASGAAALAVPVADTLRRGASGRFEATVDREGLWRMQTPQGSRREVLADALARAEREGWTATDEVGVLQRMGAAVALVEGDERNIKLTRPSDWLLAQALWAHREM